jgi:hypothetical protein
VPPVIAPEVHARRLLASLAETQSVIDRFEGRPDRDTAAAIDEVRGALEILQKTFAGYEADLDQISEPELRENCRLVITAQVAVLSQYLTELETGEAWP